MLHEKRISPMNFDALAVCSWISATTLIVTQIPFFELQHLPGCWAISAVGLASCLALTELRRKRIEVEVKILRDASTTDPLTGVGNRRWLEIEMKQRLAQFRRQNAPFSVLMLDIDYFKRINDDWGHDVGDLVLIKIAGVMRRTLRDMDVVCRVGGEEFLAILPGTGIKAAAAASERIRHAVEQAIISCQEREISVTVSIGVTTAIAMDEIDPILKRADDAMYASKRSGRNHVSVKTSGSIVLIDSRDELPEGQSMFELELVR